MYCLPRWFFRIWLVEFSENGGGEDDFPGFCKVNINLLLVLSKKRESLSISLVFFPSVAHQRRKLQGDQVLDLVARILQRRERC